MPIKIMPLYEYECKSCDRVVEILVRSTQERAECPHCGNPRIQQIFSVPASPAIRNGSSLPVAAGGEACGAPRCCGGGCQL